MVDSLKKDPRPVEAYVPQLNSTVAAGRWPVEQPSKSAPEVGWESWRNKGKKTLEELAAERSSLRGFVQDVRYVHER